METTPDILAWDEFYRDSRFVMVWPSEPVVRFVRRYRARHGGGVALDLGCGNGRHLFLLNREGFDAHGCDVSTVAVEGANEWMRSEGYPPSAVPLEPGAPLPYDDGAFDIVLSYGVLDSMLPDEAVRLANEAHRVLRPGGELFLTLRASADSEYMQGRAVAPNTVVIEAEVEQGTLQHFFDYGEASALVSAFEAVTIEREDRLQWSSTGRQTSRWEVHARRP